MTAVRVSALLGAFAGIALTLVVLRVEQARCAARTVALEAEWVQTRRELWRLQSRVARLRAPGRLRDRMEWLETELTPPASHEVPRSTGRVVLNQP